MCFSLNALLGFPGSPESIFPTYGWYIASASTPFGSTAIRDSPRSHRGTAVLQRSNLIKLNEKIGGQAIQIQRSQVHPSFLLNFFRLEIGYLFFLERL
jgi:hypothetical protein